MKARYKKRMKPFLDLITPKEEDKLTGLHSQYPVIHVDSPGHLQLMMTYPSVRANDTPTHHSGQTRAPLLPFSYRSVTRHVNKSLHPMLSSWVPSGLLGFLLNRRIIFWKLRSTWTPLSCTADQKNNVSSYSVLFTFTSQCWGFHHTGLH